MYRLKLIRIVAVSSLSIILFAGVVFALTRGKERALSSTEVAATASLLTAPRESISSPSPSVVPVTVSSPQAPNITYAPTDLQDRNGTLIANQVIRQPIASGSYVFWISVQPNKSVYGYEINQKTAFLIAAPPSTEDIYLLAGDGKTVVWTESNCCVRGYNLSTGKTFTIIDVSYPRTLGDVGAIPGIALDNDVLYYSDAISDLTTGEWKEGSIYGHNLVTGAETKLVEHGRRPVVKSGHPELRKHQSG